MDTRGRAQKVYILPKIMRWASNEPIVTFQLYCGILEGVNLDIQTVLCNW